MSELDRFWGNSNSQKGYLYHIFAGGLILTKRANFYRKRANSNNVFLEGSSVVGGSSVVD